MDGVHPEGLDDGQEQRGKDQDRGGDVHEGACDQQDHVHDEQDDHGVIGDAQQRGGHGLRDLQEGHDPAQNVGHADQKDHHAAHLGAFHHDVPEFFPGNVAVADAQDQGVDHGDGRALGGAENAGDDAADDHDDQGQGGDGLQGGLAQVGPAEFAGGAFIALLAGDDDGHHHAAQRPDDAGQVAGHEQRGHRGAARGQGVSDQCVGRGDQQAGGGRSAVGGGAQGFVIALLLLAFQHHRADGGSRGRSRTGNGAEQRIGAHVGHQQGAGQLAQNRHDEIDQPLGDAALVHQVARQDEERDGRQAEFAHAHENALGAGDDRDIQRHGLQNGEQRGNADGIGDGHAHHQQHRKDENDHPERLHSHNLRCLLLTFADVIDVQDGIQNVDDAADGHGDIEHAHGHPQGGGHLAHGQLGDGVAAVHQDDPREQHGDHFAEHGEELLGRGGHHLDHYGDIHVAALAGDEGRAEQAGPGKQIAHQFFRPGGRVVQDVAGEHLPAGQGGHSDQAGPRQDVHDMVEHFTDRLHNVGHFLSLTPGLQTRRCAPGSARKWGQGRGNRPAFPRAWGPPPPGRG